MEDIKKAFNKLKNGIKKECPVFSGCKFYMNAQQMKNRTATVVATYYFNARSGGLGTYRYNAETKEYTFLKTSPAEEMKEAERMLELLKTSNAFAKFNEIVPSTLSIEEKDVGHQKNIYIRFSY